jgi:DNA end-binding protein Ku
VRPYWKGHLKLALVSCPIALHAACSTAERIAFRQVNKATGNRLRQQLVDEETGAPVAPQDKGRGYEVVRGHYLIVADEELEAIEIESTHTIEVDSFVPRSQIDQRFFDTPYYITPNEPVGQEAFAVIREAVRGKGMVALGRLVLSKRERVIALEAYDKGLLGTTLRYPDEVRKAEDYFCDLPELTLAPDMLTARWRPGSAGGRGRRSGREQARACPGSPPALGQSHALPKPSLRRQTAMPHHSDRQRERRDRHERRLHAKPGAYRYVQ